MIKVRIHIWNHGNCIDDNVFIDTMLPAVPRKGDIIRISDEETEILEKQANISKNKSNYYFYNEESISFDECQYVQSVFFYTYKDYVQIEIYNTPDDPYE